MQISKYNYILYDANYSYWYNGLTHKHFRLSGALSKKLEQLLDNTDKLAIAVPDFYEKLKQGGFIIDDSVDELDIIRQKNDASIHSKDYYMIVLPTLDCNFKCWYCIQNHIPSKMSTETFEKLKRHIDYMIEEKEISSLHLDWFGGEPFMYFKEIIVPLSKYAINKCKEANIPFQNTSTTNGYYIDESVASQLEDLQFRHFQITLDGEQKEHDKVKFQNGCDSAFKHVLKNIYYLLKKNPLISLTLRINYTHQTLSANIVEQVNGLIDPEVRKQIGVALKKVWQERVDKSFATAISDIMDLFEDSGYQVQRLNHNLHFIPCYANKEYYNAINFNGNVVKCTACDDLYNKNALGKLTNQGTIEWNDGIDLKYQSKSFENSRCLKCKFLPLCMGLCPRNFLRGDTYCKYEGEDMNLEYSLLNFLSHEYK